MRRSPTAVFAAAAALLLPLLFSPPLAGAAWAPRFAALSVEAAVGLPIVVALLRDARLRAAAGVALAFAAWAVVCALASPSPAQSFFGLWEWGTGALFVLALIGMWGIGAASGASAGDRALVVQALVVAVAVNALLALLQAAVDLGRFNLGRFDARSPGLWGNPVFLAAFLVGGFWLVMHRFRERPVAWGALAVGVAGGVETSGSRFGLVLLVLAALVAVRVVGRRAAVLLGACVVVGLLLGASLTHIGGGRTGSSRLEAGTSAGLRPRAESWLSARHAVARDPLFGSGPGRFRAATSRYRTLRLAREEGPDRLYDDAHNLVVEYVTTTGLPGAALLLAFFVLVLRRGRWRSPLGGFALLVLAMHLVEPQNVALTPLALLALGAAAPAAVAPRPIVPTALRIAVVVGAAVFAAVFLVGSWHLEEARLEAQPARALDHARLARHLLPPWAEARQRTAAILLFQGRVRRDDKLLARGRGWKRTAARVEPDDPGAWADLGLSELGVGLLDDARVDLSHALRLDPWSTKALNGLGHVALGAHDPRAAARFFRQSLRVAPGQKGVQTLLHDLAP